MPIIVDGESMQLCNGIICDAANMELVYADMTEVYDKECFSGIWTGNTEVNTIHGNCPVCDDYLYIPIDFGLESSGHNSRHKETLTDPIFFGCDPCPMQYGDWVAANSSGVGSGTSYAEDICGPSSGSGSKIVYGSTTMQMIDDINGNCCTMAFNINTGFSGETGVDVPRGYTLRFYSSGFQTRAYIYITCRDMTDTGEWMSIA